MNNRSRLPVEGILFDMDNTLLRSRIDFAAMKADLMEMLVQFELLPERPQLEMFTASTLIEQAKQCGASAAQMAHIMQQVAAHEQAGMEDAGLEPGAAELLGRLQGRCTLAIVTNNAYEAALYALRRTGIADQFAVIAGREQMTALKPSPSGVLHALERCAPVRRDRWVSVGDSWIDGAAAEAAEVPFISYQSDLEAMRARGVQPHGRIDSLLQLLDWIELAGDEPKL